MNKMKTAVAAMSLLMVLAAVQAFACGDSLFRAGFGLNIPAGKVDHAVSIVIYAPADSDVFFDDAKVAARLEKAGHRVAVVHSAGALANTGDSHDYEVVLAREADFDSARQTMGTRVTNAVFVPVHLGFMKSSDKLTLSANSQLRQILDVVKLAMESVPNATPTA